MKEDTNGHTVWSIFSPVKIGTLELKNRLVFAPVALTLGSRERWEDFIAARAGGGVGLVMLASGMIMRNLPDTALRLYSDEFIPELRQISNLVHAQGARVGIQVHHLGRQNYGIGSPVGPSPIPCPVTRILPRELTTSEVEFLVEDYAEGVRRARDAGFDIAEIHGAHGYLVSQFLSARSNQRSDRYGGDVYKRARFLTDILMLTRQKMGPSFPISVRLNASDNIEGGLSPDDLDIIVKLVDEAGADLINISGGVNGSYPLTIAPFYAPPALYVETAARVKQLVRVPVSVGGRIEDITTADWIVRQGKADLIFLGRPIVADADLPLKAQRGDLGDIRPCLYCNQGCMKELEGEKEATCTVNPQVGFERRPVPKADRIKKVMVIGGGLAGLEAAWVAASRGHQVTLYEENEELGGQWYLAARSPHKQGFLRLLQWLKGQAETKGVQIKTGIQVTVDSVVQEQPDTVILATGAKPIMPSIPGINGAVLAWDVLRGLRQVGNTVVIIGGNSVGLETAHYLAVQGKKVTVLEMQSSIGSDMVATVRWHLRHLLDDHDVQIMRSTRLKEICSDGLVVDTKEGEKILPGAEDIVIAVGSRPENNLLSVVKDLVHEVYVIGDAAKPRNGLAAVREGWETGCKV